MFVRGDNRSLSVITLLKQKDLLSIQVMKYHHKYHKNKPDLKLLDGKNMRFRDQSNS